MRYPIVATLLFLVACQSTVTVNAADAGADSGTPDAGDGGTGGGGSISRASDAGVCNFACTAGQFCATTGDCVVCLSDADCKSSQVGTHCDTRPGALAQFGTCVECVQSSQCGSGMSCSPATDSCVPTCSDASCSAGSMALICDPQSGTCVDCLHDSDCSGQLCDPVTLSCVDCLQPSDCSAGLPGCYQGVCGNCNVAANCPGSETCVDQTCGCTADQECPTSAPSCIVDAGVCGCAGTCASPDICDPGQGFAGLCVAPCTTNSCTANAQTGLGFCDTSNGLCVQCLSDTQCTEVDSPICLAGSCAQCATASDCAGVADAGTPYCSVPLGGLCVQCTAPSQCTDPNNPGCDSSTGSCGSCTYDADCTSGTCDTDAGLCG